jgi:hypothetical protein
VIPKNKVFGTKFAEIKFASAVDALKVFVQATMKLSRLSLLFPVASVTALVFPAFATPYMSPKCQPKGVVPPPNGAGVLFDETCSVAYVMPPVTGQAELSALAQNANLQFCPAQLKVGKIAEKTVGAADKISAQLVSMIDGFKPASDELSDLRSQVIGAKATKDEAEGLLNDSKSKDKVLFDQIETAATSLKQCVVLVKDPNTECASQQSALDSAKADYKAFLPEIAKRETSSRAAKREFEILEGELQQKTTQYVTVTTPLFDLQAKLFELNNDIMDLYKQYSPLEGATGQIVYTIQWDTLVADYQKANPGLNLTWAKLPLQDASFSATVRTGTTTDLSLPAVLWSRVPGAKAAGPSSGVDGNVTIGPSATTPSGSNIADVAIGFGTSVSGQLALSLNGACPYFEAGVDVNKTAVDFPGFTAHLIGNLDYTYEMAARRGYTARYNLSNMVSRFEKKSKSGGWFSSRSAHEVVEDNSSSDWFEINFDADASEFQYTAQEQSDITKDVKAGLIDRALKNMAAINGLNSTPPPAPAMPGATGVGVAAVSLRKTCYWNYYCLGASFVLSSLDSIFGSTSAVSNFKKSNSVWVEDKVRGIQILDRNGALTFRTLSEIND